MELHESTEDYLEAILNIKNDQGYVRSVDIATHMNVTKPSVTYATKKLKDGGYIDYDANGMIFLTDKGLKIASDVWEKHQTLSEFFIYLGVKEKQALIDACKVEHDLSPETFKAIKNFVKNNVDKK
ncbi:MAG: metal-dependent transcriptional regulator [Lachnospiraceae bacterium]|nr:metal-dependent transcriptional regulator [Lachnospiraceae bacterium]